jgi:hypothetical protein
MRTFLASFEGLSRDPFPHRADFMKSASIAAYQQEMRRQVQLRADEGCRQG